MLKKTQKTKNKKAVVKPAKKINESKKMTAKKSNLTNKLELAKKYK